MLSSVLEKEKKRFKSMTESQLTKTAQTALQWMMRQTDPADSDSVSGLFICITVSIKLGFCTVSLSQKQKQFINDVMAQFLTPEGRSAMLSEVSTEIEKTDYYNIGCYIRTGDLHLGREMLAMLFSAAYIDGELSDDVAEKIDPVFKELFRYYSDRDAFSRIPAVTNCVTGLEAQILNVMFKNKNMMSFSEIKLAFPHETAEDVQTALKNLCARDYVYYLFNVIGEPYSLQVSRNQVRLDLPEDFGKKKDIAARPGSAEPVGDNKLYTVAQVAFTPGGKKYEYLCDIPVAPGDRCVVETSTGEKVVTVVNILKKKESQLPLPVFMCKMILRKAEE
ncbi:MAG: hypothetical protein IJK40_04620 [Clostridia bacterium]|nr:hypothetical protein [Clostridia bacterium]